ncbi:MAG: 50S ribosomal protein L9 [Actinobacteria bacterium]|nr:50S ribosomal protein L9 [Actinomycetota bacterium]
MKVILKEEVDNLGYAGDVVDVAAGYGRNYLIPRGMAIYATDGALKEAEVLTRKRKKREAATIGDAEERKEAIESRTLRVGKRVDEKGHLYGSVGPTDIEEVLRERGYEIERRRIDLPRNIKEIGEYQVTIHLHPQVDAEVTVEVVDVEGEVTLESLEEERRAEKGVPAESLEERALEAAEEIESQEAAEAEAEAEAESDREVVIEEATGETGRGTGAREGEGMSAAEEALLAQAAAPSEVEQVTIESQGETEEEEEPEES